MGTILGVLIAPDAGRVTVKKIRDEADKLIDKAIAQSKIKIGLDSDAVNHSFSNMS